MTLPIHIQKAAEEAAEEYEKSDWRIQGVEGYLEPSLIDSHMEGVQWLYDFLLKDVPEFDGKAVYETAKIKWNEASYPCWDYVVRGAHWQHEQSSAQISALKLELAEKDKWKKCAQEMVEALELCHRRMKHTAWVEDECFDKVTEVLANFNAINEPKGE